MVKQEQHGPKRGGVEEGSAGEMMRSRHSIPSQGYAWRAYTSIRSLEVTLAKCKSTVAIFRVATSLLRLRTWLVASLGTKYKVSRMRECLVDSISVCEEHDASIIAHVEGRAGTFCGMHFKARVGAESTEHRVGDG